MKLKDVAKRFRIRSGDDFHLDSIAPDETLGLTIDKEDAKALLALGIERKRDLQEKLYADGRRSILIILQAMDAAGKTAPLSTSCQALIRRAVAYIPSKRRGRKN